MTLPNFLIIGAARSGTTSLYHGLRQHPEIFLPLVKEVRFFTNHWANGLAWYEQHFAGSEDYPARGEATVSYSYPHLADTPTRIRDVIGSTRLIYVVREPVERTWSHYLHQRNYAQDERGEFEKAIEASPLYLGASYYAEVIRRYRAVHGKDSLLLVCFDDLVRDPPGTYRTIFRFLGVNPDFEPVGVEEGTNATFEPRSPRLHRMYLRLARSRLRRGVERLVPERLRPGVRNRIRALTGTGSRPQMSPATRARLIRHFAPQIVELEQLVDRRFDGWRQAGAAG